MDLDYKQILLKYPQPNRFRHHIKSNVYFPYHPNLSVSSHYPDLISTIDWKDVFLNGKTPNSLDIGCGMGKFLIQYGFDNTNENVLGLEVRPMPVDWIKSVILGEQYQNIGVLHYTLANGLDFIEDNSLDSIYYFFPDPWFKNKQSKRRVLNQQFLEICYQKLKLDGKLFVQTDVTELNKYHLLELNKFNQTNKYEIKELPKNEPWDLLKTDQELHVIKKGFDIFRIICTKQ